MNPDDDVHTQPTHPHRLKLFNLANALTAARLCSAPILLWCILQMRWWLAVGCLVIAVVTDVYDGKVARSQGSDSAAGGFFDHATDAALVSAASWALAQHGLITFWLCPLIALAFIQYAADSRVLQGQVLRTSKLGKYNGVGYYILVSTTIGCQAFASLLSTSAMPWPTGISLLIQLDQIVYVAAWLLVASSLASMLDRLVHAIAAKIT